VELLDNMGAMIARDAPPALQTLVSALLRTKLELAIAGLDSCGKTTLCATLPHASAAGPMMAPMQTAPTIGLVVQRARTRGIDLMLWDLGGHHRFRDDWKRHARGCGALIFVVDCANESRLVEARQALQRLLEDPIVGGLPLLVLANKVDLLTPADRAREEVSGWRALVEQLNLGGEVSGASSRQWSVLGVSATRGTNLDKVVRWLVLQAHGAGPAPSVDIDDGPPGHSRLSWQSVSTAVSSAKRRWTKSGRYTSVLADASRSLIFSE
jgi:small GTP-binding protein